VKVEFLNAGSGRGRACCGRVQNPNRRTRIDEDAISGVMRARLSCQQEIGDYRTVQEAKEGNVHGDLRHIDETGHIDISYIDTHAGQCRRLPLLHETPRQRRPRSMQEGKECRRLRGVGKCGKGGKD
jgi:hypothetical protein